MPHNFLSGLSYPVLGRYEESGEEGKKQLGFLRTTPSPRRPSRIATLVRINRRRPLAHKQWKHKLNHAVFAAATYEIAFLQNDVTGMQADVQPVMARADYPFLCRLRPLQQPVTQLHKFCHQRFGLAPSHRRGINFRGQQDRRSDIGTAFQTIFLAFSRKLE